MARVVLVRTMSEYFVPKPSEYFVPKPLVAQDAPGVRYFKRRCENARLYEIHECGSGVEAPYIVLSFPGSGLPGRLFFANVAPDGRILCTDYVPQRGSGIAMTFASLLAEFGLEPDLIAEAVYAEIRTERERGRP